MRRAILAVVVLTALLLSAAALSAQEITPTPEGPVTTPEVALTATPELPTAIPTPAPTQVPVSPIPLDALRVLAAARLDMDLLVAQQLGAERPVGWSGSGNIYDVQLALLIRLDLELLAGRLLGPNVRPLGWFGPIPGPILSVARDIRHDLELLADSVIVVNVRPPGWTGDDPVLRCDRSTQALVYLLERGGAFSLNVNSSDFDFCQKAALQASQYVNDAVLTTNAILSISSPPVPSGQTVAISSNIRVETDLAVAYLNRWGTEHVGPAPRGAQIQPLGRSFAPFSRMVLFRGDGFEVFLDYRDTSMTDDEFASLPDVGSVPNNPLCSAPWCQPITYTLGNPASRRGG